MDKRRITTPLGKYLVNPIVKAAVAVQLAPSSYVILETTSRKSGQPRRTPVGTRLDRNTLWLVAEHGRRANYVRNIEANPGIRVKVRDKWRSGTAHTLPDDNPQERLRKIGLCFNGAVVQIMGTELLPVRIDLDP
jgi:deazaflavin-dependent oxidoreductase (nitroreductase family)